MPLATLIATCVLALALVVASSAVMALVRSPQRPAGAGADAGDRDATTSTRHWVNTWSAMPQLTEPSNMPPAPFTGDRAVLVDTTLRQTVRVTTGGEHVRLRFSNAFGDTALPLTAVTVALPLGGQAGAGAIEPGTSRTVTFGGRESTTVPVGALDFDRAVRDPENPGRLLPTLHDGDWLHLNPEGYRTLAATVPPRLLQRG